MWVKLKVHFITAAVCLASLASAGEVTGLTTFTAGTPAKAAEVNGNFTAVKAAVDDNHARLTAAESTQNAHDSRLHVIENSLNAAGAVSLSAYAFSKYSNQTTDTECEFIRGTGFLYADEVGRRCLAAAPLALPDGATLQGVTCLVYDSEDLAAVVSPNLKRTNLATGETENVYETTARSTSVGLESIGTSSALTDAEVDNAAYAYYLTVFFDAMAATSLDSLRLYGCKVAYQL